MIDAGDVADMADVTWPGLQVSIYGCMSQVAGGRSAWLSHWVTGCLLLVISEDGVVDKLKQY